MFKYSILDLVKKKFKYVRKQEVCLLKNHIHKKALILIALLLLVFTIGGCTENILGESVNQNNLEVHFIDVGQGDSVFIRQNKSTMLIDAGENHYGELVVDYLKKEGVSKLDYVVGTHPHSDHIGGLDDVINEFEIGKVIMPKVTHTTQTFQDVILAVKAKDMKITTPGVGDVYSLGNAKYTILGPSSESYSNLNNYSVVLKLNYGDTSFMFTGDAEREAEEEVLDLNKNISVDLLKLGHHGSKTSTIDEFLKQTNPSYGVIQVGENNSYNLPDKEVIDKLQAKDIEVYRNDIHGTVKVTSNGKDIFIQTEKASDNIIEKEETEDVESYIGNKNSEIFHREDCSSTVSEQNRVYLQSRDEAISEGFRPCKVCNP